MNQTVTNAAYTTLQTLAIPADARQALTGAEYNRDRNYWSFTATDAQFTAICVALREANKR